MMKVSNVKGIVWDLDGTLLDSFRIFQKILAEVVAKSGHKMPSEQDFAKNYHGTLEETIQNLLRVTSSKELDELVLSFLSKQEKYYQVDLDSYLFSDAIDLAKAAAKKGIHQIIVTNRKDLGRSSASPHFIVASTVLSESIEEVRSGDKVEISKPSIASIGDWDRRHKLLPSEMLVIGDQFVDAKLAINLGCKAILVRRSEEEIAHLEKEVLLYNNSISIVDSLDDIELT